MPDTRMLAALSVFIGCTVAFVALVQLLVWLAGRYQSHFGQVLDVELARLHLFVDSRRLMWAHLGLVAAFAVVVVITAGRLWLGALVVLFGAALPRLVLGMLARRRRDRFRRQLPDTMAMLAGGLRAGLGLGAVLPDIADRMPAPVRDELRMIERQRRLGATLETALAQLEQRMPLEETRLLVSVLRLGARSGASMSDTLDAQAGLLRRRLLLEGKIHALTAQGRMQGWVMGLLPFVVLVAMLGLDPSLVPLYFDTNAGRLLLVTVVLMQLAGGVSIMRLVAIRT
ncbi:MAG: type II secretion system F family protein [Burkholderiaceae bacterium]